MLSNTALTWLLLVAILMFFASSFFCCVLAYAINKDRREVRRLVVELEAYCLEDAQNTKKLYEDDGPWDGKSVDDMLEENRSLLEKEIETAIVRHPAGKKRDIPAGWNSQEDYDAFLDDFDPDRNRSVINIDDYRRPD